MCFAIYTELAVCLRLALGFKTEINYMCLFAFANVTFWFFTCLCVNLRICENKNEYTYEHIQICFS